MVVSSWDDKTAYTLIYRPIFYQYKEHTFKKHLMKGLGIYEETETAYLKTRWKIEIKRKNNSNATGACLLL